MRNILLILFFLLLTNSTAKESELNANFGFVSQSRFLSNFKDARDSLGTWIEEMGKKNDTTLNVTFFTNPDQLFDEYKTSKIDMAVFSLPYFFRNKEKIDKISDDYWTLSFTENKFAQFYLIANKSFNIKSIKDLKNKYISLKEFDEVSETWIDKESLINNHASIKNTAKSILYEAKESTALLNVYFKKAQVAVVSKKTWDIMIELNPAVKKSLVVIDKSEKIHLPFIGMFRKGTDKKVVDVFFKLTINLKKLYNSSEILDLLKFDSIFRMREEDFILLTKFYEEYFDLKKKYD